MHPYHTGRASRIDGLDRLIRTMRQEPGVWFVTCMQVAEWAIETGQNADVRVPIGEDRADSASGTSHQL